MSAEIDRATMRKRLTDASREGVEDYISERETPLCEELTRLEFSLLSREQRRARAREIRDERAALWELRAMWRRAHRPEHAGPDQFINMDRT